METASVADDGFGRLLAAIVVVLLAVVPYPLVLRNFPMILSALVDMEDVEDEAALIEREGPTIVAKRECEKETDNEVD
ncbi:hypothetical protein L1887_10928 [Cichorium endivia]|nr:hypothetical protein L1887_10928 [Cichorium endivia]